MQGWKNTVELSHTANHSLGKIRISLADIKALSLLFPLHHAQTNCAHFLPENPVMEGVFLLLSL